ncbi:unnamed protein product [Protopolystoma xenopodis]|uniref:Syndetin C-terminal domain-containing protein n=1 Tax=Protopolystoma xenopodis TaxID=117903 RepID=A0A3S5ACY1_9PLAT|nr:unnamed protein product [Protopolystoma xenopodis]
MRIKSAHTSSITPSVTSTPRPSRVSLTVNRMFSSITDTGSITNESFSATDPSQSVIGGGGTSEGSVTGAGIVSASDNFAAIGNSGNGSIVELSGEALPRLVSPEEWLVYRIAKGGCTDRRQPGARMARPPKPTAVVATAVSSVINRRLVSGPVIGGESVAAIASRSNTGGFEGGGKRGNFSGLGGSGISWAAKEVATAPSDYVSDIEALFEQLKSDLHEVADLRLGLPLVSQRGLVWYGLLHRIAELLLDGLAGVSICSDEGRARMLLDVQTIAQFGEMASGIKPFPNLVLITDFVQAYYVPVAAWDSWLLSNSLRYTRTQLVGLAGCLSRGDRRLRQRLIVSVDALQTGSNTLSGSGIPGPSVPGIS